LINRKVEAGNNLDNDSQFKNPIEKYFPNKIVQDREAWFGTKYNWQRKLVIFPCEDLICFIFYIRIKDNF